MLKKINHYVKYDEFEKRIKYLEDKICDLEKRLNDKEIQINSLPSSINSMVDDFNKYAQTNITTNISPISFKD